jgi:hypothetical protein
MKESTTRYLIQEYRTLAEMENRIEGVKQEKLDYIKSLEKRFRKGCSIKEAQSRVKDHLERFPKGAENKKIKDLETRLRHMLKQVASKHKNIDDITEREKENS